MTPARLKQLSGLPSSRLGRRTKFALASMYAMPGLVRRALLVREVLPLLRRSFDGLVMAAPYSLRRSGVVVYLRHGTADVMCFDQGFGRRRYAPPPPVADALAALPRPPRMLDVGASVGLFGVAMLERFPQASIIALEPDPVVATVLRRCVRANGRRETWRVVEAWGATHGSAPAQSKGSPTIDITPFLGSVDYLHIDGHGVELELLAHRDFAAAEVPALAIVVRVPENSGDARLLLERTGYRIVDTFAQADGSLLIWARRALAGDDGRGDGS